MSLFCQLHMNTGRHAWVLLTETLTLRALRRDRQQPCFWREAAKKECAVCIHRKIPRDRTDRVCPIRTGIVSILDDRTDGKTRWLMVKVMRLTSGNCL